MMMYHDNVFVKRILTLEKESVHGDIFYAKFSRQIFFKQIIIEQFNYS